MSPKTPNQHQQTAESGHRVGSDYIRGFLKGATLQGCSPESILEKAGLPSDCYKDPHASIDGRQFYQLLLAVGEATQDVFMGFLEQPGKLGMEIAHIRLWVQAKTLGEAIRNSTQLRAQFRNDVHYDYITDEQHHTFTLGVNNYQLKPAVDPFLFYWHRLMQIYRAYCWLVGKRIKLNRVGFAMPEPAVCHSDLQSVFHCEVLFDQPANYLCFDKSYLHTPVIRTEAEVVYRDIDKQYPDWFSIPGHDHSWSRQVEDVVVQLHRQGKGETASLATVARIINVSARTLRRQLLLESESVKSIKDRVRLNLAIKLLVTTDTPVARIASETGYSDPGSFSRAFLNWTGCTPSEYRRQHASDQALMAQVAINPIFERHATPE